MTDPKEFSGSPKEQSIRAALYDGTDIAFEVHGHCCASEGPIEERLRTALASARSLVKRLEVAEPLLEEKKEAE